MSLIPSCKCIGAELLNFSYSLQHFYYGASFTPNLVAVQIGMPSLWSLWPAGLRDRDCISCLWGGGNLEEGITLKPQWKKLIKAYFFGKAGVRYSRVPCTNKAFLALFVRWSSCARCARNGVPRTMYVSVIVSQRYVRDACDGVSVVIFTW